MPSGVPHGTSHRGTSHRGTSHRGTSHRGTPPQAADNSKLVVDKIRVEVRKAQVARNLSDEQTMQLFQQNFEHSLDQLIGAIRTNPNP